VTSILEGVTFFTLFAIHFATFGSKQKLNK